MQKYSIFIKRFVTDEGSMLTEKPTRYEKVGVYCSVVTWCVLVAVALTSFGSWEFNGHYAQANNVLIVILAGMPLYVVSFICFLVLILFACRIRYYILVVAPTCIWVLSSWIAVDYFRRG